MRRSAILLIFITGCSNLTTLDSPGDAAVLDDLSLCARYRSNLCGGIYGCPEDTIAIAELKKRNLIENDEWQLVRDRKIMIGMSECALRASWGPHFSINTTATRHGVRKQYVFGEFGPYVYVEHGEVTAWQD